MDPSTSDGVPVGYSAYESSQGFSTLLARTVADATNKYGVRSSKRTDAIHMFIKSYIEKNNSNVTCVVEYKLETGLGIFKVDVAIFHRTTNKLLACLLFKGLTSSISKNDKNYEHNKLGEAVKAKTGMGDAALVFMDVIPVRCPTYNGSGEIQCWESHPFDALHVRSKAFMAVANDGRISPCIDDIYTISVDYTYGEKKDIVLAGIVNDSDIERFEVFIRSLAPVVG